MKVFKTRLCEAGYRTEGSEHGGIFMHGFYYRLHLRFGSSRKISMKHFASPADTLRQMCDSMRASKSTDLPSRINLNLAVQLIWGVESHCDKGAYIMPYSWKKVVEDDGEEYMAIDEKVIGALGLLTE